MPSWDLREVPLYCQKCRRLEDVFMSNFIREIVERMTSEEGDLRNGRGNRQKKSNLEYCCFV